MTFYRYKALHYLIFSKHYHPSLLRLLFLDLTSCLKSIPDYLWFLPFLSSFFPFRPPFLMASCCMFRQCWSGDRMWQVFPCVMPKHCWSRYDMFVFCFSINLSLLDYILHGIVVYCSVINLSGDSDIIKTLPGDHWEIFSW